nr:MAG TPA: hypothetical protein [Bacteriophage sp.]
MGIHTTKYNTNFCYWYMSKPQYVLIFLMETHIKIQSTYLLNIL